MIHVPRMENLIELEKRISALEDIVSQRPIDIDAMYTVSEVAKRLRCGGTNVYQLVGSKELGVTRVGAGNAGLRIKGSDLLSFLDARKEGGTKPKGTFKHLKAFR